jgi:hypothetical protein
VDVANVKPFYPAAGESLVIKEVLYGGSGNSLKRRLLLVNTVAPYTLIIPTISCHRQALASGHVEYAADEGAPRSEQMSNGSECRQHTTLQELVREPRAPGVRRLLVPVLEKLLGLLLCNVESLLPHCERGEAREELAKEDGQFVCVATELHSEARVRRIDLACESPE